MPNIKGSFSNWATNPDGSALSPAIGDTNCFYNATTQTLNKLSYKNTSSTTRDVVFNASRSSSIYSDSVNTVQPPAITLIPQIKYRKATTMYEQIDAVVNYSTTEKVVGTWIDGKPLYQKTIVDTMPTVTTDGTRVVKTIDIDNLKVKYAVKLDGFFLNSSDGSIFINSIINILNTVPYLFEAQCVKSNDNNTNVDLIHLGSTATWANNQPCYITLQYTKTTD